MCLNSQHRGNSTLLIWIYNLELDLAAKFNDICIQLQPNLSSAETINVGSHFFLSDLRLSGG